MPERFYTKYWLEESDLNAASFPGALIAFSCAKYCSSYTQQYFAQEKAIRAPGNKADSLNYNRFYQL